MDNDCDGYDDDYYPDGDSDDHEEDHHEDKDRRRKRSAHHRVRRSGHTKKKDAWMDDLVKEVKNFIFKFY